MKPLVYVTREFTFDSAHALRNYTGACAQLHGHTYRLQVTVKGVPHPQTGMVMDFELLGDVVRTLVLEWLDHTNLTEFFDEYAGGTNTTAENICIWIFGVLQSPLSSGDKALHSVRLWETPNSFVEFMGEYA